MNIREARPDEYAAVGELRVVAYRALGLLPEGSGYAETLRGFGFADGCVVLVAVGEAGSGILGTITLEPFGPANELAQDETEADVRAFAVAPQAQGQGVGRKLLLAVIEFAGKRGVCRLRLCSQSAMKAAQHLYTRTGFSRTPDLDFEPVPGITLRAYELALPSNPFSGQQPDKQPVSLSLARRGVRLHPVPGARYPQELIIGGAAEGIIRPGGLVGESGSSGQPGVTSRTSPVANAAARLEDSPGNRWADPGCPGRVALTRRRSWPAPRWSPVVRRSPWRGPDRP